MNLSLTGRQLDLSDAMKTHITGAVEALKKFNLDIISTRVVVSNDEKNGKKGSLVEFAINLAHKNTIVIKQKDKDLYAAVDLAVERAKKVLRRHHDKVTDHQATKLGDEMVDSSMSESGKDYEVDEIVPMELDLYKPLNIEEALDMLKQSKQHFLIFNDMDDKTRVIYKRKDDKYGLY